MCCRVSLLLVLQGIMVACVAGCHGCHNGLCVVGCHNCVARVSCLLLYGVS